MSAGDQAAQEWKANRYAEHAPFVPLLGMPVLELLKPRPGECILDVGCGDGVLSQKIFEFGATVVGVDGSPDLVDAARSAVLTPASPMLFIFPSRPNSRQPFQAPHFIG